MKSDSEIERDVKDELEFDPDLDPTDIAVSVRKGVVTLTGFVHSFTEKYEAEAAAKRVAGVAAHDLRVIVECEKAKLDVDFYQKTFHSHEYFTAPRPGETDALGPHDNSWCSDPQAVVDVMATVKKPWIAFKILAAGAIQPRAAFPYAFNSGADFILVGMFDWQVEEDVKLARRVIAAVASPDSKRTRPWYGGAPTALARG